MASGAQIGALRVALGLDSAQFTRGLKQAETGLGRFGKTAGVAFAAVAAAGVAAGAALGVAVKGAIDHADQLSKTAQKIGITTEALSRLEHAAKLSDVSLSQLSGGVARLSKAMFDVANGASGPAKTAFDALGVSIVDANGKLRSSEAVFADVAEGISRLEDSSQKTALSMAIFGRSGADLIPMLNLGREGLKSMGDEADRLGLTISTQTGKAAEQFNDSLTRLNGVFQGIVNKVMEAVLPTLNEFGDTLASPEFVKSAQNIATAIVQAMDAVAKVVIAVTNAFGDLARAMEWANTHDIFGNERPISELELAKRRFDARRTLAGALGGGRFDAPGDDFFSGIFGSPAKIIENLPKEEDFDPVVRGLGNVRSASEEAADVLGRIGSVAQESASLSADAMTMTAGRFGAFVGEASKLLGGIFEESKELAIAQAVLSAGEGIARTMGAYPFPYNLAMAALHGVQAIAQISKIAATTPASKSYGALPAAAPAAAPEPAASSLTINVMGTGQRADQSRDLIRQIEAELLRQGKRMAVVPA